MARKKKHPEHVNHERWLVSYADFITLLFAFFVVMFAVSQVDSKKLGRFTESFSKATGLDIFPDTGRGILPGADVDSTAPSENPSHSPLPAELAGLRATLDELTKKRELPSGLQVLVRRNEIVVRLSDNALFQSGDDELNESAKEAVFTLSRELRARNVGVRVEGHTDDRPIHTSRFRSNWELSTSRATAVVRLLAKDGMPAAQLSAAGYGEFHPISTNATDEGRKQNRRVDFVVSVLHVEPTEAP